MSSREELGSVLAILIRGKVPRESRSHRCPALVSLADRQAWSWRSAGRPWRPLASAPDTQAVDGSQGRERHARGIGIWLKYPASKYRRGLSIVVALRKGRLIVDQTLLRGDPACGHRRSHRAVRALGRMDPNRSGITCHSRGHRTRELLFIGMTRKDSKQRLSAHPRRVFERHSLIAQDLSWSSRLGSRWHRSGWFPAK